MKKRLTGVAFVLVLALTSLAFAKGPPVPEGCVFERGTTTCTEVVRDEASRFFLGTVRVTLPGCSSADESKYSFSVTTTVSKYRGVSHVQKDDPVVTVDSVLVTEVVCSPAEPS